MARIVPLTPLVDLATRRGALRFRSRLRDARRHGALAPRYALDLVFVARRR